jgi:uncharacterized RDD family membrane protein YckC
MATKHQGLSRQGNYAGAVSRLVAFVADAVIAWGALLLIFAAISAAATIVTGHSYQLDKYHLIGLIVVCCWYPIYFAYQWALSGKTLGMAIFGLRVVTTEGRAIESRQAIIRTLMLPISIFVFGLGLFGIVLRIDHRGWHDRAAKTCIVYDWDARAARMRWLARKSDLPAARSTASSDS